MQILWAFRCNPLRGGSSRQGPCMEVCMKKNNHPAPDTNTKFPRYIRKKNQAKKISPVLLLILCAFSWLMAASCRKSSDWIQFRGEGGRGATSTGI
ncbi:MAG: hypothetical protein LBK44_05070, partial [Spirochaetales bacterium]|nr:hypothetical protein [Spirochaetales bacterium]